MSSHTNTTTTKVIKVSLIFLFVTLAQSLHAQYWWNAYTTTEQPPFSVPYSYQSAFEAMDSLCVKVGAAYGETVCELPSQGQCSFLYTVEQEERCLYAVGMASARSTNDLTCTADSLFNPNTGKCDPNYTPPSTCPEGQTNDPENPDTCICEDSNMVLDPQTNQCQIQNKELGENECGKSVGDPVNSKTGNSIQTYTVYKDVAPGLLEFTLSYNLQDTRSGAVGAKWLSNYHRRLTIEPNRILVRHPKGKILTFSYSATGATILNGEADRTEQLVQTATGWDYILNDNRIEQYDTQGRLRQINDKNGYSMTLTYNGVDQLERVEDTLGRALVFGHNVNGHVSTVQAPDSRQWGLRYDTNANLEFIDNPDTTIRQFHYERAGFPNALTGITDERSQRYVTWEINSQGRVNANYHPGNVNRIDLLYNTDGTTTITNSRGNSSVYSFIQQHDVSLVTNISGPGCSSCSVGDSSYEYDPANSNLLAKTIKGLRTEYGNYDSNGNPGFMIEAAGTPQARTTAYTYDPRFLSKVATQIEPSVCPGSKKVTAYGYDDFGNTTSVTVNGYKPDCTTVIRTTTLQYNGPFNQVTQIDGPRTDVSDITTLEYYPNNVQEGNNRAHMRKVTAANGIVLRDNIQYTATGKVQSEQRTNGILITYTYYPGNDRLETVTESDGSTSRTTRWSYLPTGEVETITLGDGTAQAITITLGYDAARRLERITDNNGNYIHYTLDTEGNPEAENVYSNISSSILMRTIIQTFDVYNRLDTTTQANENRDYNFNPDSTLDSYIDGKSATTKYGYDDLKRLVSITQDLGGTDPNTQDTLTQYGYDVQDNLTSVTDPNNGNTTYTYDDLGNLLQQTSPDTGTSDMAYDEAGNVRTRTDAKGQAFSYSYDALNRIKLLDAPGSAEDSSYVYDTCTNGTGHLCSVTQGTIVTTYAYNAYGDVVLHQGVGYSYDALGRMKSITYPSGNRVTYLYNNNGRIEQVDAILAGTSQTLASNITYAPFGPMTGVTYGNGLQLNQNFDTGYRLTSQSIPGIYERSYSLYDGNGNLQEISDLIAVNDDVFGYDNLNQLKDAAGIYGVLSYSYDKNGNRTSQSDGVEPVSFTYEPDSNRLDTVNTTDVILDANGNTLNDGRHTYGFNSLNRLASIDDTLATYQYNTLGQRISKTIKTTIKGDADGDGQLTQFDFRFIAVYIHRDGTYNELYDCDSNGLLDQNDFTCFRETWSAQTSTIPSVTETHYYIYDTKGWLLGVYDSAGNAINEYVYLNGIPVAVTAGNVVNYIHTDHLGTARAITDQTAQIIWRWSSDPFGNSTPDEDADGDGILFAYNLRFPGQYYDTESGLYYNYFRYYDPSTGRYITSDPIGLDGGLNTYGYTKGNPINLVDILGLAPGDRHPAPQATYTTQRDAATAAGNAARDISNLTEFGCYICPKPDGGFGLTDFVEGTPVKIDGEDLNKLRIEQCPNAEGNFHSHLPSSSPNAPNDKPSEADRDFADWHRDNTNVKDLWLLNKGDVLIRY